MLMYIGCWNPNLQKITVDTKLSDDSELMLSHQHRLEPIAASQFQRYKLNNSHIEEIVF